MRKLRTAKSKKTARELWEEHGYRVPVRMTTVRFSHFAPEERDDRPFTDDERTERLAALAEDVGLTIPAAAQAVGGCVTSSPLTFDELLAHHKCCAFRFGLRKIFRPYSG